MSNISTKDKINLFTLVVLSSSFVISIRNIATMAETGLAMLFFGLFAAICFFIPAALVSAELATGWPKRGGIYVWVSEAFGKKWGFFTSFLEWSNMLLSVTSMLYFVGGSLAFVFSPELAQNKIFLISILLIVVWGSTFINMHGIKANSLVSSICFLAGVLFPAILIIFLGIFYLTQGYASNLSFDFSWKNVFPDFSHITTLVFLLSFTRTFTGIEAPANHAANVVHPQRNYPIAIFIVVLLGLGINLLGAASIAVVVPKEEISLIAGVMEAFHKFFTTLNINWLIPYIGILVAGGAIGGANAWLLGPVQGLLQTARHGNLPPVFRKVNKHGIPTNLLIAQGVIVSIVGSFFLLSKSINLAFWTAVALSMMIYAVMYFMLMLSGLYLRYKRPDVPRSYKIFGGKIGIWCICLIAMATLIFLMIIALFPPAQIKNGNRISYFLTISLGAATVFLMPFIIRLFKKKSWVETNEE